MKQRIAFNYLRFLADDASEADKMEYHFSPKQASHVIRGYEMLCRYNLKEDIFAIFVTKKRDFIYSIKRGKYEKALTTSIVFDYAKKIDAFTLQLD
jgi:hypothetical protein